MGLLNSLELASRIGYDLALQRALDSVSLTQVMQRSVSVNMSRTALMEGADALLPMPVKIFDANLQNLSSMNVKPSAINFNPVTMLMNQKNGQALSDLIKPKAVQQAEDKRDMEAFERMNGALKRSPLKTAMHRSRMAAVKQQLQEKRLAYRMQQTAEERIAREKRMGVQPDDKEMRMGVQRDIKKYPITARKQQKNMAPTVYKNKKRNQY